jgi:hypothetical protein
MGREPGQEFLLVVIGREWFVRGGVRVKVSG